MPTYLFAKLSLRLIGILVPIAAGFPIIFSNAIAQEKFPAIARSSIGQTTVGQTTVSQGFDTDNPGLMPSTSSNNWQDIFESLRQKEEEEPPANSRSDDEEFCIVSPATVWSRSTIWHMPPLFVWQGELQKIEVISRDTYEILWSQEILPEETSILYQGQPLEAGSLYEVIFIGNELNQTIQISLQIMDNEGRDRISRELKIMEEALVTNGVDVETLSQNRARYFIEKNLWSDVVQEIFSVENPSNELTELRQSTIEILCESDETDSANLQDFIEAN